MSMRGMLSNLISIRCTRQSDSCSPNFTAMDAGQGGRMGREGGGRGGQRGRCGRSATNVPVGWDGKCNSANCSGHRIPIVVIWGKGRSEKAEGRRQNEEGRTGTARQIGARRGGGAVGWAYRESRRGSRQFQNMCFSQTNPPIFVWKFFLSCAW